MRTEDDPYYKCLSCRQYVDPASGHIAGPNGTVHWHCHPQLKYKSDIYLNKAEELSMETLKNGNT